MSAKFNFSDVVVVHGNLIGVIVKSWGTAIQGGVNKGYSHDVYVRSYNTIENIAESDIKHFIYDKELSDEVMEYQE